MVNANLSILYKDSIVPLMDALVAYAQAVCSVKMEYVDKPECYIYILGYIIFDGVLRQRFVYHWR